MFVQMDMLEMALPIEYCLLANNVRSATCSGNYSGIGPGTLKVRGDLSDLRIGSPQKTEACQSCKLGRFTVLVLLLQFATVWFGLFGCKV